MHHAAGGRANEIADLPQPGLGQPALPASPLNREAVGKRLVWPAELMAAFVRENPKFHGRGNAREKSRIEDNEPRKCCAIVIELAIKDRGPASTMHPHVVNHEIAGRYQSPADLCGVVGCGRCIGGSSRCMESNRCDEQGRYRRQPDH